MAHSPSIRIGQELYEQARQDAAAGPRSISEQIELWARVGRAALDNPDLPVSFIVESLASLREPRELARPFVARADREVTAVLKSTVPNPRQVEPPDASGAGRLAAVEAMRQFKKITGVRGEDVAAWIAEGRKNDLGA
jgi:hypothetical protein